MYRELVRNFHPQMHPELTAVQKELFQKAQEAFRRRDIPTLRLIYEMLVSTADYGDLLGLLQRQFPTEDEEMNRTEQCEVSADYKLAALIYPNFRPTAMENSVRKEWIGYQKSIENKLEERNDLQKQFPYNAAEMLSDSATVEAYKEEPQQRLRQAKLNSERLRQMICTMLEGVSAHG